MNDTINDRSRMLPHKLTDEERAQRGEAMAKAVHARAAAMIVKRDWVKKKNEELRALEKDIVDLATVVETGVEDQLTGLQTFVNLRTNALITKRLDTLEEIDTRALTAAERMRAAQLSLELGEKAKDEGVTFEFLPDADSTSDVADDEEEDDEEDDDFSAGAGEPS